MFFKLLFIFFHFLLISSKEEISSDEVIEGNGGELNIRVEEEVLVLSEENFDVVVLSKSLILVEFFTHWCGHCQRLAPEYSRAAQMLREERIPLAKVDANKEESLAKRFSVQSFPTLLVFTNGSHHEYDGPRTALGIVEYMRQRADPEWRPPPEVVITLTSENFEKTIESEELVLVEFFAPWCGHCQRLAPEYERAAKRLLEEKIPLAKVDATLETELAKRFQVSGYPTLLVFRKGKPKKYSGGRDESAIVAHMKGWKVSPSTPFESVTKLKKSLSLEWPTIVGLFASVDLFEVFIETAFLERERNFRFFHSFDSKVFSDLKENKDFLLIIPPLLFHSDFEPNRHRLSMDSSVTSEEISAFIVNNSRPLVGLRSPSSHWLFQSFPLVVVYYDVDLSFEHRKQSELTRQQVLRVANKYKGKVTFCVSKEEDYSEELKDLKLEDNGEDVSVGFFASPKVRYAMTPEEEFDAKTLHTFVESVLKGSAQRVLKSQSAPAHNEGPVVVVVADTFHSLVFNSGKRVLIEFFAPGCGHCQQLEPIYRQLAQRMSERRPDLIVAKMDATANDVPEEFDVSGFPALFLVSGKTRIEYSGDRSLEALTQFVDSRDEL